MKKMLTNTVIHKPARPTYPAALTELPACDPSPEAMAAGDRQAGL